MSWKERALAAEATLAWALQVLSALCRGLTPKTNPKLKAARNTEEEGVTTIQDRIDSCDKILAEDEPEAQGGKGNGGGRHDDASGSD